MIFQLYLISILTGIRYAMLLIPIAAAIIAWVGVAMAYEEVRREERRGLLKATRRFSCILALVYLMGLLVPTSKDMYIIYGISKFSETEIVKDVNNITRKSLQLLENKLDKYLEEE